MVLEGAVNMKRFLFIFTGIILTFIVGALISIPLHNLFSGYFVNSHDDENQLAGVRIIYCMADLFNGWRTFREPYI